MAIRVGHFFVYRVYKIIRNIFIYPITHTHMRAGPRADTPRNTHSHAHIHSLTQLSKVSSSNQWPPLLSPQQGFQVFAPQGSGMGSSARHRLPEAYTHSGGVCVFPRGLASNGIQDLV